MRLDLTCPFGLGTWDLTWDLGFETWDLTWDLGFETWDLTWDLGIGTWDSTWDLTLGIWKQLWIDITNDFNCVFQLASILRNSKSCIDDVEDDIGGGDWRSDGVQHARPPGGRWAFHGKNRVEIPEFIQRTGNKHQTENILQVCFRASSAGSTGVRLLGQNIPDQSVRRWDPTEDTRGTDTTRDERDQPRSKQDWENIISRFYQVCKH